MLSGKKRAYSHETPKITNLLANAIDALCDATELNYECNTKSSYVELRRIDLVSVVVYLLVALTMYNELTLCKQLHKITVAR